MKQLILLCIIFCFSCSGICQFVPQPLNYPGIGYWPFYYSIVDPDHVWVGTFNENGLPCPFSVKTINGGETWTFNSIPVEGNPGCVSICGWDTNTCFFVFITENGPSIWKTTDGGDTWSNIITTQFSGSFVNFYHAFSADTGIAMGDPVNGNFEIYRTTNGGETWNPIPIAAIPPPLDNEMGLNNSYSAVGNSIWFTTNKARCYHSSNQGLTWDVTEVFPGLTTDMGICFSSALKGVIWNRPASTNQLVVTNDGGVHWNTVVFPSGYYIQDMSRVPGWEGSFVITAFKMGTGMVVYFTPDMFNTILVIQPGILSNGAVEFYDVATGWLGGGESGTNEIYKYTGILTANKKAEKSLGYLSIMPNPSSEDALICFPVKENIKSVELKVIDITGKVIFRYPIEHSTGYAKLSSSIFESGVYIVEVLSGNNLIGRSTWIVNH